MISMVYSPTNHGYFYIKIKIEMFKQAHNHLLIVYPILLDIVHLHLVHLQYTCC